jgi:tRNA-Thr(GGU) m(6)t(6)A37 methyltransferase TsaA
MGLESFSHIYVLYWLHKNDTPIRRRTLQVHPKHNPKNPLTGVFATHAPVRPNPIALSICKILSIGKNRIFVDGIDALNNSPVLDLKCYNPDGGAETNVTVPQWAISTEAY